MKFNVSISSIIMSNKNPFSTPICNVIDLEVNAPKMGLGFDISTRNFYFLSSVFYRGRVPYEMS